MSTTRPSVSPRPGAARALRVVAAKELRESLRDGRFRLLAASVFLLLAAGLSTGWLETREAHRAIDGARHAERTTWLDQGPRNPHSAAHFGNYAFKPRPALASLDRGVDAYLGTAVWLEAHWQDPFALRPAEDRTAVQRFGELTAAFTLQVLAPLLIIVLGFGTVAGERERGTLRQLASLGLGPRTLVLGKGIGLGAALGLVLVPAAVVAAALAAGAAPGGEAEGGGLSGGLALFGVYAVYFVTWLALVLAVSSWADRARTALVVLLGFWMLQALVVPRLVADLAERTHPIPTPRAFFAAIAEDSARGMDGRGTPAERRQALEGRVLAEYGVDSVAELPINFAGLALQDSEEHANLVYDKHYGDLWGRYLAQERLHLWGAALSPRLAVRSLSMAVAGTDIARHRHFADAAEQHRRKLVKFLNDDMTENAGEASFGYLADEALWEASPTFSYRPPDLGTALGRQGPAFAWLGAWLLAGFGLAALAVRRLRILPGARP
ncbi:MAG: DUF3526 domain-containing protein [Acidobacteriota bacterium]